MNFDDRIGSVSDRRSPSVGTGGSTKLSSLSRFGHQNSLEPPPSASQWRIHLRKRQAQADKHARRDAFTFEHHGKQQMFGANQRVIQFVGFVNGVLDHLARAGGKADHVGDGARAAMDNDELDRIANSLAINTQFLEEQGGQTLLFAYQTEQQVFGANEFLLAIACLFLRGIEYAPGAD